MIWGDGGPFIFQKSYFCSLSKTDHRRAGEKAESGQEFMSVQSNEKMRIAKMSTVRMEKRRIQDIF